MADTSGHVLSEESITELTLSVLLKVSPGATFIKLMWGDEFYRWHARIIEVVGYE